MKRSFQTRRGFLRRSAAAAAGVFAAPAVLSACSPNEQLHVAIVGCGGRGGGNMREMLRERVVALCDVNEVKLAQAAERAAKAAKFLDFRRMYDSLTDGQFDAVVVSSTEHTHAFATLPALRRKKHVYCEKPLAHNVLETRRVTEAAQQAGVATQMGTQIHAGNNYRRVVEIVRSDLLGAVREAHVWVSRAWGRQSQDDARRNRDIVWSNERPAEAQPVPKGLDWQLWLGPAVDRPYHSIYFPGPKWYRWWDFGGGTMSDLGSHWIDLPFWALDLDAPISVEAAGPPPHAEIAPASMSARYQYPARGPRPAVEVNWYQGAEKPEWWTRGKIPQWGNGVLFVGEKAMLLADYGKHALLSPDGQEIRDFERPDQSIPESLGHHGEWIHACKTGAPTTCHFGYSGPLTEANHLGNVAYRSGQRIQWDAQRLVIPNARDAEQFLTREYRSGWSLG